MELPIFVIYHDRALKAVPTEEGGIQALEYDPREGKFRPNANVIGILLCPTDSQDLAREVVSESEFEDYVASLRKGT